MTTYTIYKATNTVNNKVYVGITSRNWAERKLEHEQSSFWKTTPAYNHLFHSAIRKYGVGAFVWDSIYQSTDKESTINCMEEHFIREYNSHYLDGHGYNMTYGGQGNFGYVFSTAHRRKISESQLGKTVSKEARHKMSIADRSKGSKMWRLTNALGESHDTINLAKWARDNGTIKQALLRVYYGARTHWRGWKVMQIDQCGIPVPYVRPNARRV